VGSRGWNEVWVGLDCLGGLGGRDASNEKAEEEYNDWSFSDLGGESKSASRTRIGIDGTLCGLDEFPFTTITTSLTPRMASGPNQPITKLLAQKTRATPG
jgi:hypothetical protein